MSGLFSRSTVEFDKLFEKATSQLLLETDWNTTLQICDCIRQNEVEPKYVVLSLKKKLHVQNDQVVLNTLKIIECIVKNCGDSMNTEIISEPFLEDLTNIVKNSTNESVKNKIFELIQAWVCAFRDKPIYHEAQNMFNVLLMEGYELHVPQESEAMFSSYSAPKWIDNDSCYHCHVLFTMIKRKHHCRNCGQIFCNSCSSRTTPIPRFGFEKEVRVCEACWKNLKELPSASDTNLFNSESLPKQIPKISCPPNAPLSDQELMEDEELQLVLALSQSEAEFKMSNTNPITMQ